MYNYVIVEFESACSSSKFFTDYIIHHCFLIKMKFINYVNFLLLLGGGGLDLCDINRP